MAELSKIQLTNKLKKLGKFIKENRKDTDKIFDKIQEIFPNSLEVDVFDESYDSIYFITPYKFIGAINKKQIKENDSNFKEILSTSNIDVIISVDSEDISITASIFIRYFNKWNLIYDMDIAVKELNL